MSTGKKSIYELHIPTTMSVVWRHVFNNSRCQNKTLPNIILKCFSLTKKSELVQAECSWFVHEVDQVYCQRPGMQSGMYMCNINILSIAYSIHVMYSTLWFQVKTRHYDIRDFLFTPNIVLVLFTLCIWVSLSWQKLACFCWQEIGQCMRVRVFIFNGNGILIEQVYVQYTTKYSCKKDISQTHDICICTCITIYYWLV